ncbi:Ubiquitin fusion degradation protein 4 [Rhodotorula kratochvilovae]
MPARSTRNKPPPAPPAAAAPAPAAPAPAPDPARTRKRKSTAADPADEPAPPDTSTPAPRRSRRTSTANAAAASAAEPSAKALGKRRAVSPFDSPAADSSPAAAAAASSATAAAATPASSATKRRKLAHAATPADKDYNLRARPARSTASASAATSTPASSGKKTRSSPAKKTAPMPRKGATRATRAAKAKARAMSDDEDEGAFDAHHREGDEGDDVEMEDAAGPASSRAKKRGGAAQQKKEASPAAAESAAPAPAEGSEAQGGDLGPLAIVDSDEDDHSGDDEDSFSDEDDEDEFGDDDEEIEEFETALGMHGEERDDYTDEEDVVDAPRTFNADGDPLSSQAAADEAAADAEADALFGALAGAAGRAGGDDGGAGGALSAFRALHGMMSGMSSRLKTLLASLKATDGDGTGKLLALQELAELLSISTEDTLAGYFQIEAFSKELIAIVRGDSNGMASSGEAVGGAMTVEEAIAFGLDPAEVGAGGGGAGSDANDEQMMLLACRCLANLMEALPGSAHSVVYAGAVPVLCDKLKDIQYIDLAEQTLSTLEKISEEVPHAIVREGGLSALLTYLDFFSFHVQRTAVTAAANCCRSLSPDSFPRVVEVMPILQNVLGYADQRVVEQGCLAVVRIVDSYRHYPDKLEQLLTADLLKAVRALLNPDSTTVGVSTYTQSLKMLTTAARASPAVAISLVELGLAHTLYHLLTGVAPPEWQSDDGAQVLARETTAEDDMLVMQNLVQRPKEQIAEALACVSELLPPLPKDGIFDARAFTPGKERSASRASKVKREEAPAPAVKREEATPELAGAAAAPVAASTSAAAPAPAEDLAGDVKMEAADEPAPASVAARRAPALGRTSSSSTSRSKRSRDPNKDALLAKRLELVAPDAPPARKLVFRRFVALLLPTLVDVSAASVSPQVRTKAVLGLLKMVHFSDADALADVLRNVPFAAFISAILSSREHQPALITSALQLVELLLVKMPDAYEYTFRREGVMHEIDRLANEELVSVPAAGKSKRGSPVRTPRSDEPASSPAAAATPLSPLDAQAKDAATLRARHLRSAYGASDSDPATRAQGVLDRIKALVVHLAGESAAETSAREAEREAKSALDEVAALFADEKNPLSSFEMVESGLVEGLLKFATESTAGPLPPAKRQELIAHAFMPQLTGGSATPAFAALVKRLQESLSRLEEFEVVVAAQNPNDIDSRRNGTSMLGRQLKLRLIAEDADIPRSCTNIVVSIHAIATFESFNSYLRPRILAAQQASGSGGGGSGVGGAGTLSSLLAAFAAAAGATDEGDEDADGAMLSSSPPPRRTELGGDVAAIAAALSGAGASTSAAASSGSKPMDGSPKRRRSSRLSGKGVDADEADEEQPQASTSKAVEKPVQDPELMDEDPCEDDEEAYRRENQDLYAGSLDGPQLPREDKPVNLEVTDEKVVAKTPDGTRVATPQPAKAAAASSSSSRPSPAPTPQKRSSYAAALKAEPTDFHLEFSLGGQDVTLDTTVFGAVHRFESQQPAALRRQMWYNIYDVKYRKVEGAARPDEDDANALGDRRRREGSIFTSMPSSIPTGSQQAKILQLLHVLRTVSADYGEVAGVKSAGLPDTAFVNSKLTAKLNRQLEEPMIVASACLPDWSVDLAQSFPFLFPFDTRYTFLQSTSFGYARLMQKWVGQTRSDTSRRDENLGFLGRLPRQKVRISRDRILESAYKVFELYGSSRASLEVEFFDEVGSGLGPTLEFYALVSKEFARKALGLWREGDHTDTSDYVHTRTGLFPLPLADATTEAGKKVLRVFRILGQFVAKAMMDTRIIDVNFSRTLMRLVLEHDVPLTIASVTAVDPELGKSLAHLQEYVAAKEEIEADESTSADERRNKVDAIQVDGASVADLVLDFTLPGRDIELKEGGSSTTVDIDNLAEYIELVIEWTLKRGVEAQVAEFQRGFSSVFPVRDLQTFTPAELVMMTAAVEEDWTVETLANSTKADHGFTMDSRPVRDFLGIMSEFSAEERREFLSFITGSPRLPIGGFSALSPPLTIVRKDGGDSMLPSVMTCVNFVKLPNYSSREVVRERILMAVREGAGGFHLS